MAKKLGEQLCDVKVNEHDATWLDITFQVVDKANKALLWVHRVCAQGHDVFLLGEEG